MGLLRIFLACIVLLHHCPEGMIPKFFSPVTAVQCFYCLSGFYIQLLIRQFSQIPNWHSKFYKSRFLRIYPTYILFVAVALLFYPEHIRIVSPNSQLTNYFLFMIDNIFILTQDIMIFLDRAFAIVPVSWTLSVEIMFYLIAPFILLKKTRWIVLLILLSISCRLILNEYGYNDARWLYTFFPSELSTFLFGSLAYRFYEKYLKNSKFTFADILGLIMLIYLFRVYYFGNNHIRTLQLNIHGDSFAWWYIIVATAISLPFIFKLTNSSKLDRYIGELSYPVYMGHLVVLYWVETHIEKQYQNITTLLFTIVVSIIVMRIIEIPLSKFRQSYKLQKRIDNNVKNDDLLSAPNQVSYS